jgi:hypothetical protein
MSKANRGRGVPVAPSQPMFGSHDGTPVRPVSHLADYASLSSASPNIMSPLKPGRLKTGGAVKKPTKNPVVKTAKKILKKADGGSVNDSVTSVKQVPSRPTLAEVVQASQPPQYTSRPSMSEVQQALQMKKCGGAVTKGKK